MRGNPESGGTHSAGLGQEQAARGKYSTRRASTKGTAVLRTMLAAVLLLLLGTSCSSQEDAQEPAVPAKREVALVVKSQNSDYWKTVISGADAAAKEYDVKLVTLAPESEQQAEAQVALVKEVVDYKRDALVLAATDDQALIGAVARAAAHNIPVIAIDSEIDSPKVLSYIGINHYEAGKQAARKLAELMDDSGRAALAGYRSGSRTAAQRERGFLDEMAEHPKIQVTERTYCHTDVSSC